MSGEKRIRGEDEKPGFSKGLILQEEGPREGDHGIEGEAMAEEDDVVLDQLILVPEIMNMILQHLDFQSLKRARLVCKSWHMEARDHLERRGLVCLYSKNRADQDQPVSDSFIDLMRQQENQTLPQAFRRMEMKTSYFHYHDNYYVGPELLQSHISILCPPLVISRFDPLGIPFDLSFRLITQFASSLEILKLEAGDCRSAYEPILDPKLCFTKLQHLVVECSFLNELIDYPNHWIHFPPTIAWIVKASPNLEQYGFRGGGGNTMELTSELILQVDIKRVKKLFIVWECNRVAFEHFLSIPFSQLQKLYISLYPEGVSRDGSPVALIATVAKCKDTLKSLDLAHVDVSSPEKLIGFPICPNIQELKIDSFPYTTSFLSAHFPSLQVLDVGRIDLHLVPLIPGLKTLRVSQTLLNNDVPKSIVTLLQNFPGLERLNLESWIVLRCCRLKANGDPRFANLLEGVKHLTLFKPLGRGHEAVSGSDYGFLSVLKGIETIKLLDRNEFIESIPFQDLPSLRVIQFPWGEDRNMNKLLEIARGVETVVVTDCCSSYLAFSRPERKELLKRFFEAAPNAKCGCNKEPNWVWL